jgi:hypothetical protein
MNTTTQLKAIDSDCGLSSLAYSPDGKFLAAGYAVNNSFITVFERK